MAAPHWHAQAEVNFVFRGAMTTRCTAIRPTCRPGTSRSSGAACRTASWTRAEDTLLPRHPPAALPLLPPAARAGPPAAAHARGDAGHRASRAATTTRAFSAGRATCARSDPRQVGHAIDELLLRLERIGLEPHRLLEPAAAQRCRRSRPSRRASRASAASAASSPRTSARTSTAPTSPSRPTSTRSTP